MLNATVLEINVIYNHSLGAI